MKTFIYPDKDTTLYESSASKNTGIDQIIEITHTLDSNNNPYNSRILMKFNLDNISSSLATGTITDPSYYLRLSVVQASEIPRNFTIEAYPVSGSWDMGLGKDKHSPITTEGASWNYSDGLTGLTSWVTGSNNGATASWATIEGGGNWFTGSNYLSTQSFSNEIIDVRMNVTNIVEAWMSSSIDNEGFIIKRDDTDENSPEIQGSLKFFSSDTNTIYIPRLEIVWDDSTFTDTGSISEVSDINDTIVSPILRNTYRDGSRSKIRMRVRPTYPIRTWVTSSNYLTNYYLPTESYYQIKDSHTGDIIFDFGEGTKLSRDNEGNYFNIWMDAFQPDRFYNLSFKSEDEDGNIELYDNNYNFKVKK